jgi:hypothetical protein
MPKRVVNVTADVGYENHSVQLTLGEWKRVNAGAFLERSVKDYYEGEKFIYVFSFNSPRHVNDSLVVEYDDGGEGFLGSIDDATVSFDES